MGMQESTSWYVQVAELFITGGTQFSCIAYGNLHITICDQGPIGNLQMLCTSYLYVFVCDHSPCFTMSNKTGLTVIVTS
jgi:hypothetical protein